MTSFADFVVSDSLSKFSKVLAIHRQYEREYSPAADFWSRFQQGVEGVLSSGGKPIDLDEVHKIAKDNRSTQYLSACRGFQRFWGNRTIELIGRPKTEIWEHDRLQVKINPELIVRIDGRAMTLKLHLKDKLTLTQRLSNPLLFLLDQKFSSELEPRGVGILDVHRGKLWIPGSSRKVLEPVLQMEAASFLQGPLCQPLVRQSALTN